MKTTILTSFGVLFATLFKAVYQTLVWGYVAFSLYYWFLFSNFNRLPFLTFREIALTYGAVMLLSLFLKWINLGISKKKDKADEESEPEPEEENLLQKIQEKKVDWTNYGIHLLAPWLLLLAGWLIRVTILALT